MRIKFKDIKNFKELKKVQIESYKDKRGLFSRIYCKKELKKINFAIKQINLSVNTKKGTLRGLHYMSKPSKEKKIVFCIKGAIFDVVIDLRKNSKTYLKKKYFYLDEKKKIWNLYTIRLCTWVSNIEKRFAYYLFPFRILQK